MHKTQAVWVPDLLLATQQEPLDDPDPTGLWSHPVIRWFARVRVRGVRGERIMAHDRIMETDDPILIRSWNVLVLLFGRSHVLAVLGPWDGLA